MIRAIKKATQISPLFMLLLALVIAINLQTVDADDSNKTTDERYRPQFHYSHSSNSLLDPVGLYRDFSGKFNVFYLQNENIEGAEKVYNWGHATSRNLVQWK